MQAERQRARRSTPRGTLSGGTASDPVRPYGVPRSRPAAMPTRARPPRTAGLRSTLGVALLPCAFAATVAWLVFLGWLVVVLAELPFR